MDMKKTLLNKIVMVIDISLIIAVWVLQYYSTRKMGMLRFLVYENRKLQEGWFSPDLMKLYEYILIMITILCTLYIFYNAIKAKGLSKAGTALFAISLSSFTYFILLFEKARELKTYFFILIALFIMCVLQYLLVGYSMLIKKILRNK